MSVQLVPSIALDQPLFDNCPNVVALTEILAMGIRERSLDDHSPIKYFVVLAKFALILYPSQPMGQPTTPRAPFECNAPAYGVYPTTYQILKPN